MIWFLCILVYTAISIWYFLNIMGYKFRKGRWYDYPLLAPVSVIATIAGWIRTLVGWNK